VDADGCEGFWIVANEQLIAPLAIMAEVQAQMRNRPHCLPRQPMVAELPGKSTLADVVARMYPVLQ